MCLHDGILNLIQVNVINGGNSLKGQIQVWYPLTLAPQRGAT